MRLESVLRSLLFVSLLSVAARVSWKSVERYREGRISESVSYGSDDGGDGRDDDDDAERLLTPPSITVCCDIPPYTPIGDNLTFGDLPGEPFTLEVSMRMSPRPESELTWFTSPLRGSRCATWNSDEKMGTGADSGIRLVLGLVREKHFDCHKTDCGNAYPIFLHKKGDFIYSVKQESFGRSMTLGSAFNIQWASLWRRNVKKQPVDGSCSESATLASWRECYMRAGDEDAGCRLPGREERHDLEPCEVEVLGNHSSLSQLAMYKFHYLTEEQIRRQTGCAPPCSYFEFPTAINPYTVPQAKQDPPTIVYYANYRDDRVETVQEYLEFNLVSLLGELGGLLGLLLGFSVLDLGGRIIDRSLGMVRVRRKILGQV